MSFYPFFTDTYYSSSRGIVRKVEDSNRVIRSVNQRTDKTFFDKVFVYRIVTLMDWLLTYKEHDKHEPLVHICNFVFVGSCLFNPPPPPPRLSAHPFGGRIPHIYFKGNIPICYK